MEPNSTPNPTSALPTPSSNGRRKYYLAAGAVLVALIVGVTVAVVSSNRGTPVVDKVAAGVAVGTVAGTGDILVDGEGRTLYLFVPDEADQVTCTGGCADKWPPLVANGDAEPQVADGIDPALVSTVKDQDGARVLTVKGWPLYRYTSDKVGEVTGNGKDQNGGVWWALTPEGKRVKAS